MSTRPSWPYKEHATWLLYGTTGASLLLIWFFPAVAAFLGAEDSIIENLTAFIFLVTSVILVTKAWLYIFTDRKNLLTASILIAFAVIFFVFAGEEISWGQRILGFQTSELLLIHNWQGEMNLHNLQTDISNIGYHYGALLFLIVMPLMGVHVKRLLGILHFSTLKDFISPVWLAFPSLAVLGMIDPRFIYAIEKPWAASFYLIALFIGIALLGFRLYRSTLAKNAKEVRLLILSFLLIVIGLYVSFLQAIDFSPNSISEYKELVIALALFIYTLQWKKS